MQVDPADISPHKVWGPLLLLLLPFINGLVALVSFPAAIRVMIPTLPWELSVLFGLVAFFVMFVIELLIVTWAPAPPRWVGAIAAPKDERLVAQWRALPILNWFFPTARSVGPAGYEQNSSGYFVPPMPSFPERLLSFLPRLALTLVVAVFVGGGANLALNAGSISYEKRLLQIDESRAEADKAYNAQIETLGARIKEKQDSRDIHSMQLERWQRRLNCNLGNQSGEACKEWDITVGDGGPDTILSRGQVKIFTDAVAADDEALKQLRKASDDLVAAGTPSSRPDFQPPPESLTQGINTTLAAFNSYVKKNNISFVEAHIAEIFLAVLDLVPVTFKLLNGFPPHEHQAWNRGIREILARRYQLRNTMRLQAMGYEYLDSPQAQRILGIAAVKVVEAMARRWVLDEEAMVPPTEADPLAPKSRNNNKQQGTQPPGGDESPSAASEPPWPTPDDEDASSEWKAASFIHNNFLWAVGPRIISDGWARKGTDIRFAARVATREKRPEFSPAADCYAVKLAKDPRRLQREVTFDGNLNDEGCIHTRGEIHLDDQGNDLYRFDMGLLYRYCPFTDAERYFGALAAGVLDDAENTYYRLTDWTRTLVRVIAALADKGWAHDDIKPRNFLVGGGTPLPGGGRERAGIFLIDWDNLYQYNTHYRPAGTLDYRAPELDKAGMAPSFATDLYSVGASMFHLATGTTPADWLRSNGLTPGQPEALKALLTFDAREQLVAAGAPSTFAELVHRMLEVDPVARPKPLQMETLVDKALTDPDLKTATVKLTASHRLSDPDLPSGWNQSITEFIKDCGYTLPDWMAHK